jgi:hypothetical protein
MSNHRWLWRLPDVAPRCSVTHDTHYAHAGLGDGQGRICAAARTRPGWNVEYFVTSCAAGPAFEWLRQRARSRPQHARVPWSGRFRELTPFLAKFSSRCDRQILGFRMGNDKLPKRGLIRSKKLFPCTAAFLQTHLFDLHTRSNFSRSAGALGVKTKTMSDLKLPMDPPGENVHRPAILVVSGVGDKLIIGGQMRRCR